MLHFKRAACFAAMDRSREAATEASRALDVHPAYTSALLLRARQRVKLGRADEARSDFVRYVTLAEEARACPYPPENEELRCYFDMPSEVTLDQLRLVKREMERLKTTTPVTTEKTHREREGLDTTPVARGNTNTNSNGKSSAGKEKKSWKNCCSWGVTSQVAEPCVVTRMDGIGQL